MGVASAVPRRSREGAFLVTNGDYITGQVITIDGGLYT